MIKIKNVKQDGNTVNFNVSGVDIAMLNALRRTIISEVPIMAVELVTYHMNTSILADEVLAHRIGLVPIKTDPKLFNRIENCTCKGKGCSKCTMKLSFKMNGPGTAYTRDLVPVDKETKPVYDTIPLTKLTATQELDFEATAQLGIARNHAKWQAGLASYEQKDDNTFNYMIETYGQLTVKQLAESAFQAMDDKLAELKKQLK